MRTKKRLVIIIPCHNEQKGIAKVIKSVPFEVLQKMGYKTEIIVVDNASTDKTANVAQKSNAKVISELKLGKGNALKSGLLSLPKDVDVVIIIDGDNTYKSVEIPRIIEPIENNFADVIVGSRLSGKTKLNSLSFDHRFANWFYTFLVRHFYRVNTTDVLSGFIGMRKKVVNDLLPYLESNGFAIEMEFNIKASRSGYSIYSVPITYDRREGNSKVEGLRDAIKILYAFFKYLNWNKANNVRRKTYKL